MKKLWRDAREALHAAAANLAVRILVGLLAALGGGKAALDLAGPAVVPPALSSR